MLSRRSNLAELDGRDLQSIDSSWLTPETNAQLDARHSLGGWNQFEANKKLYNFQDTYDENIYTKKLDRSQLTREQLERADLLANSIESSTTTNFHLREERGQISTGEEENYDEEDRYSGVLRQPSPGTSSRTSSKPKNSPTSASGSWRRVPLPSASNPSSGTSKPSYAAAAGKNSQSNPKVEPALPPGFGAAPPTEGGYFKSNIDASIIEPNISFYGAETSAAPAPASVTVETKVEAPVEVIPGPSSEKEPEIVPTPITESVTLPVETPAVAPTNKAPTPPPSENAPVESETFSPPNQTPLSPTEVSKPGTPSDTSSVTSVSAPQNRLRATAAEWKPPSSTSSPNPTTATPTPTPVGPQGQGSSYNGGNGNSNNFNQRTNNRSKGRNNSNYRNGGGGGNYQQAQVAANTSYDQANMYGPGMITYYDPMQMQMYPPQYQDMGGVFMPFDHAAVAAGYYPPQFYPVPPNFDPSYHHQMLPMYPEQMMPIPPPYNYATEVVGMDHANHGVSVAPGLSDMGMKGNNDNNEGN
jgi:hypothetical protein